MNRKKRIETVLKKAFVGWRIEIIDNSIEHIGLFRSAVPSANHLKEGDVLHLGVNALALSGGTIKDKGTNTNSLISAAADVGYNGGVNRGGDIAADGSTIELGGPRAIVLA